MPEPEDRSPLDLLCDLLVYAPVGFAFEAPKLLPELATKGRDQVAAARTIGQFVVRQAGTRVAPLVGSMLSGVLSGLVREDSDPSGDAAPDDPPEGRSSGEGSAPVVAALPGTDDSGDPVEAVAVTDGGRRGSSTAPVLTPVPGDTWTSDAGTDDAGTDDDEVPASEALAIPHYDSLAASQVVPRLTALTEGELEAVAAYESAHRGRRTILHRTDQLLGRARERT